MTAVASSKWMLHWWWLRRDTPPPHMIVKHYGCTAIHNKALYKCIIHSFNKKKKVLVNCWPSGKYVNLLYLYSILGRGSFCFNYCLNSAWHGGDQFVAMLRWYGSPGFFDHGLQLICIFWSLVSNFHLDNTP